MQRYMAIATEKSAGTRRFYRRSQSLRGEEENRVPSAPGKSTLVVQVLISEVEAPDPGYSDLPSAVMRSSPCRCIGAATGVHAMARWGRSYGSLTTRLGPRGEYSVPQMFSKLPRVCPPIGVDM